MRPVRWLWVTLGVFAVLATVSVLSRLGCAGPDAAPERAVSPLQGTAAPRPDPERRVLPTRTTHPQPSPGWLPAEFSGWVVDTLGNPVAHARVESEDCGWSGRTDADGQWSRLVHARQCTVVAVREDGLIEVRSPDAAVFLDPGQRTEVSFVLPAAHQGGIGVAVRADERGVVVTGVREDSPAQHAGITVGTVIRAVDGLSTAEWSPRVFSTATTGPVGSTVAVDIWRPREGVSQRLLLERAWLPPGDVEHPHPVSLASLTDEERRELAAIREALMALDDGSGVDLDDPAVQEWVQRVMEIAGAPAPGVVSRQ